MVIENGSAIISLERLKELEKNFEEINDIKASYSKKEEDLTVNITSDLQGWCYGGDADLGYKVKTMDIKNPEVSEKIREEIHKLNQYNIDRKNIFDAIFQKLINMSFIDRLKFLFRPTKYITSAQKIRK